MDRFPVVNPNIQLIEFDLYCELKNLSKKIQKWWTKLIFGLRTKNNGIKTELPQNVDAWKQLKVTQPLLISNYIY
jgi:hypothetical protein